MKLLMFIENTQSQNSMCMTQMLMCPCMQTRAGGFYWL